MGNVWVRSSCSMQLWLINHKNCITDLLLFILYSIDVIAYSISGALNFLERRKKIYGPNFASLGRIIVGEYEKCAEIIQSPQQRGKYLGRAKLAPRKISSVFPLFLSDADAGGDDRHAILHKHFWETLVPPSMNILDDEAFQSYLNELVTTIHEKNAGTSVKMTAKELKPMVEVMVVKYVFHAILGQALSSEEVEYANTLFNGVLPFSSYVLGATRPISGLITCFDCKRSDLVSKMTEVVLNSPALQKYTPSEATANLSKEDYAEMILSVIGIAGCLGSTNLCLQILTAIPDEYSINLEDKMEVTLAVLEAARLKSPVNNINVILKNELTLMIREKEYKFPKGTVVAASIGLSSVDASQFQNPHKYDPKREKLMTSCLNFNHVGFSPVGAGTRQCPGRNIAVKMASDLLIALRSDV